MLDKKKIIYMIIFTIFCIGLAYLLYRVFFAPEKTIAPPTQTGSELSPGQFPSADDSDNIPPSETTINTLPISPTSPTTETERKIIQPRIITPQVKKEIDSSIMNVTRDKTGKAKFYDQSDGKFYRLNSNGEIEALSETTFYDVDSVTWSSINNEAILEYPDGSNIYYNFDTKKQVTLPKHWEDFSFSGTGDKIAAKSLGFSEENQWLITSDAEGKNIKLIEPMGANADKVEVNWSPSNQVVALSRTGEALGSDRQQILLVGLNGENFQGLIVEGRGLVDQWSPQGEKLLYSVYNARNDYQPELWVVNAYGDQIGTNRRLLGLNTWADKCTFENERFVYCGVPSFLETGAGFARQIADYTTDKLIKIDLESGIKTEIPLNSSHTIDTIFLDSTNENIYFTDKSQNGLFSIEL